MSDYRKVYYDKYLSDKGISYNEADYRKWVPVYKAKTKGLIPSNREIKVLELACGPGFFLYTLEKAGYLNLTGVEISGEQTSFAKKFCKHTNVYQEDVLYFLTNCNEEFDLIAGFDIIEHFRKEEILHLMQLITQRLKKGGTLLLHTPNAVSPFFGSTAYGDFTHEWFFTPRSMTELLKKYGFEGFQFRRNSPLPVGLGGTLRTFIWKILSAIIKLFYIIESGSDQGGIYSRAIICKATLVKTQ